MTREQRYLELVTESGAKRVLTLEPGRDTGVWCLAGDGSLRPAGPQIEGARVFLRFDGARLFVGTQWDELQPPAQLTTGGLRIAYRVGAPPRERADSDDEKTEIRAPLIAAAIRTPRPPSSVIVDDDATRVVPSPYQQPAAAKPSPVPPPASPSPLVLKKPDAPAFPRPPVEAKRAFGDDESTGSVRRQTCARKRRCPS